ncbi:MAG: substrate-binding domain-containing protein [Polyangiaceae bacterium]
MRISLTGLSTIFAQRFEKGISLGVMLDSVRDPYQIGILGGVTAAASEAGVSLLCFVGGSLPTDLGDGVHHRIFDLIDPRNVDGVVVLTATLMHRVGHSAVEAFCKARLQAIPSCSVGVTMTGIPSVVSDGARGMSEVVSHLVREHGHRRIAFVRGPLGNVEAEDRYVSYVRSLESHGLVFDARLVAVGDFLVPSGGEAVQQFARIPGTSLANLDAIVASNDGMAMGVIQALEERGITVPGMVAVTGFDDIDDARVAPSPLTTVRQPLDMMGRQAARSVLQFIQIGAPPDSVEVSTELVVRRSCGCPATWIKIKPSLAPDVNHGFDAALLVRRQHILETLTRTARGGLGVAGADWNQRMLNAFVSEMRGENPGAFGAFVDDLARGLTARNEDTQICHDVIHALRGQMLVALRGDAARRDKAEEIFYATHLAITEVQHRTMSRETIRLERWGRDVGAACNSLACAFDADELRKRLRQHLPAIGLRNFFVVVYAADRGPASARLFGASDNGGEIPPAAAGDFDGSTLLPEPFGRALRDGRALAVLPLTHRTMILGHVLVEIDLANVLCLETVAAAIASGVYGSRLAAGR